MPACDNAILFYPQIVLFAFVAVAAAPPQNQPLVKILSQSFDQDDQGSYQYAYELDNGQRVSFETLATLDHDTPRAYS